MQEESLDYAEEMAAPAEVATESQDTDFSSIMDAEDSTASSFTTPEDFQENA